MDEVLMKMADYARVIKSIDSNAVVLGPEEWGWPGYLYSGYDQQWADQHGWTNFPDRAAHGGREYIPYLIEQMKAQSNGVRLLDVLTVHIYPQSGEFSDDTSASMQLLRNRSTRSLWDPNYKDESWIDDKVMLIPRLRGWVNSYYPGTKIGITEYNWGAEKHVNGATAQADILGIFGREGLDLANRWTTPDTGSFAYHAMKMYRNYDGRRSTFGDVSVRATAPDADTLAAFASVRNGDGALTIMLISKALSGDRAITINVRNRAMSVPAQRWQLNSTNAITRVADVAPSGSQLAVTVPPQSITLLVVPSTHRRAARH